MEKDLIMVGTMEVGQALMNVIYLVKPSELDRSSGWMTVDYLYRVTDDNGVIEYDPIPNNGASKTIRTSRGKMLATAPASPNMASSFLDEIGNRELTPSDIVPIDEMSEYGAN